MLHYLHADGSGGAGPLAYLDASREELGEALETSADAAIPTLLEGCVGESRVASVLADGWHEPWPYPESPGFFRFLVLTCAVVACADENEQTQEFGANLQRLYGTTRTFGRRGGLPTLWEKLVDWSRKQREAGLPVRAVILPAKGPGEHIGMTNAVSFPSWRDIRQLRIEFEGNRTLRGRIRTPDDAARALQGRISETAGYRAQMVVAWDEYSQLYYREASLLQFHRFWAVVCGALGKAVKPKPVAVLSRAELVLGTSLSESSIRASLYERDGTERSGPDDSLQCRLDEATSRITAWAGSRGVLQRLVSCLASGAAPFVEERYGIWSFETRKPADQRRVLFLATTVRLTRLARLGTLATKKATEHWWIIGPLSGVQAADAMHALGIGTDDSLPDPLRVEGGIHTRAGWLGRPPALPWLIRQGKGSVGLSSTPLASEIPALHDSRDGRVRLESKQPLEGTYRFRLEESVGRAPALAYEKSLKFTADAPEQLDTTRPGPDWLEIPECREEAWGPLTARCGTIESEIDVRPDSQAFDDFLEIVYARGRSGWAESDLVELVRELLPGPSPWDILRALEEAEWLLCTGSVRWKARRWWLRPPRLLSMGSGWNHAMALTGSASATIRRRFRETALSLGGKFQSIAGMGPFSPTTSLALDVEPTRFCSELGWSCELPRQAIAVAAPRCWPVTDDDPARHELAARWDWRLGTFTHATRDAGRVTLDRYRRPQSDRADIYVVGYRGRALVRTRSRTVALAEAYRLSGEAMFTSGDRQLLRCISEGHLPIHLARTSYLTTLEAPGPVMSENGWTYAYRSTNESLLAIANCLGPRYIGDMHAPMAQSRSSDRIGIARHRGNTGRHLATGTGR